MCKAQQRCSVLQLAQLKTSTVGNSALSASYSKSIQTMSFFVWKTSESRDTKLCFWTRPSKSFGSSVRFLQRDCALSIHMTLMTFGKRGKWQDSYCIHLKHREFNFKFGFGFTTEDLKRKSFHSKGDIQKCWCDALLLITSLLGRDVQKMCFDGWQLEGRQESYHLYT